MEQLNSPLTRDFADFFLVTLPGLEDLAQKELVEKTSLYGLEITAHNAVQGGIAVTASLENGLELNRILKIPTRILLRLHQSKVRDFPRLFKKLKKLSWRDFLCGGMPSFKAESHRSRLIHTGRIEKTAQEALEKYYQENPIKKAFLAHKKTDQEKTIYLRIVDDELMVSIDTSGKALYFRHGYSFRPPGSLRENYAAAIFYQYQPYFQGKELLDPFAGSGTLLLESTQFYQLSQRSFAFEHFPRYQKKATVLENIQPQNEFHSKGHEINLEIFQKSKEYLSRFKEIDYQNIDSFKQVNTADYLFTNAPYGIQVKSEFSHLNQLVERLSQKYQFRVLGILHPEKFKETASLSLASHLKFSNNSIEVYFNIIKRKS